MCLYLVSAFPPLYSTSQEIGYKADFTSLGINCIIANTLAFLRGSSANRCQREEGLQSRATGPLPWIKNGADPKLVCGFSGSRQLVVPLKWAHRRSMWPPCLVWLLPPRRVGKLSTRPSGTSFSHKKKWFSHSFPQSCSHSSFHSLLLVDLAGCYMPVPDWGPFVRKAFGGIKKSARPMQAHSLPSLPLSIHSLLPSLFRKRGGKRGKSKSVIVYTALLLCVLACPQLSVRPVSSPHHSLRMTRWKRLSPSVSECNDRSGCDVALWRFLLYPWA